MSIKTLILFIGLEPQWNPDLGCHFISYNQIHPSVSRSFFRGNVVS